LRNLAILTLTLSLFAAGCGDSNSGDDQSFLGGGDVSGQALDKRAKAVGIIPDSDNIEFSGRFETRSDLGTDKFCAVKLSNKKFSIGALAVFGPESKCEARGVAAIDGEKVKITFNDKKSCSFYAEFDGVELRFPGAMDEGCASYCSDRASFSGTTYFIVEQGDTNARRVLGRDFEKLCE
jgi:hypothetical protein